MECAVGKEAAADRSSISEVRGLSIWAPLGSREGVSPEPSRALSLLCVVPTLHPCQSPVLQVWVQAQGFVVKVNSR